MSQCNNFRKCGLCGLPGHTCRICNIADDEYANNYIHPYAKTQEEMRTAGLKPMTKEEYCNAVYGMTEQEVLQACDQGYSLPAPYKPAMKLKCRIQGLAARREKYQRKQWVMQYGEHQSRRSESSYTRTPEPIDLTNTVNAAMDIWINEASTSRILLSALEELVSSDEDTPPVPSNPKVVETETCPICFDELTETNHIVGLCGHQFHASCLIKNLESSQACPCCRQKVV